MKKILLDTNIYIYLEDNKITEDNVIRLTKLLFDSNDYKLVIHPKSKEEIENYKDEEQKEIFKSKIAVYKEIKKPPRANRKFNDLLGVKNKHDLIDNELLYAIKQNCASYLITNDNEIKKKSYKINLQDKVMTIDEAIQKLKYEIPKVEIKKPAFIERVFLYQINLEDTFFDSLKNDYPKFEEWFQKKQEQESEAYITKDDNEHITSFLMLKEEGPEESYETFEKPFTSAKRLKVSTFKVETTGNRIGEAFIKIIVEEAIKRKVQEVYITIFPKQLYLIELLENYGFKLKTSIKCNNKDKENVYVKEMKNENNYYPYITVHNQKVFLVPIQDKYHNLLFQDAQRNIQLSYYDMKGQSTANNSIKKVYISNSKIKKIKPNSILLFYCSETKKAITSVGIVDSVFTDFESFEEFYRVVHKRTAYSEEELENMYKSNCLVILFKHYISFEKYINYEFLKNNKVINGPIQSIQEIDLTKFKKIINECQDVSEFINFN